MRAEGYICTTYGQTFIIYTLLEDESVISPIRLHLMHDKMAFHKQMNHSHITTRELARFGLLISTISTKHQPVNQAPCCQALCFSKGKEG